MSSSSSSSSSSSTTMSHHRKKDHEAAVTRQSVVRTNSSGSTSAVLLPDDGNATSDVSNGANGHRVVITPGLGTDDTVPPDGGYAWVCCAACFMINSFTWGVLGSYGVYLSYYLSHDTFPGARDIHYAFVGGSNFAAAMLVAPAMGWVVRQLGINQTIMVGCFIYAGGYVAASFATEFWQLVLSQGVMVGIGVGVIWQPSIAVLPQWFLRRRSLAQGIASAGAGVAGLTFSLATTPMIERISLAWALRITGLTCFVILMVAAVLLRDRNELIKPKAHPFDTKLLVEYKVVLLLGWSIFSTMGYIVLLYSLSSYAISIGLTQNQGGIVVAVQNVGTGLGRPFLGSCSDRWGRMTVAFVLTVFTSVISFAIWIPATSYGLLLVFALVSGATIGTFWATIAPLSAEVVDLVELPSMLSLTWVFIALPMLFSEAIALELRRAEKSMPYFYAQMYAGLCYLVASLFMLELRRSKWGLLGPEKHR